MRGEEYSLDQGCYSSLLIWTAFQLKDFSVKFICILPAYLAGAVYCAYAYGLESSSSSSLSWFSEMLLICGPHSCSLIIFMLLHLWQIFSDPQFLSFFCVLQDLKKVLSFPPYPVEFLHPVVYACTAVMLLCLFASIITYIVHHR